MLQDTQFCHLASVLQNVDAHVCVWWDLNQHMYTQMLKHTRMAAWLVDLTDQLGDLPCSQQMPSTNAHPNSGGHCPPAPYALHGTWASIS